MIKLELKLGDILLKQNIITQGDIENALNEQKNTNDKLGDILIKAGVCTETDIAIALSKQLGILFVSIAKGLLVPNIYQELEKLIPENYARYHRVVPLSRYLHRITVAFVDPLDLITIDDIMKMTGCDVTVVVCSGTDLNIILDDFYQSQDIKKKKIQEQFILTEQDLGKQEQVDIRNIFSESEAAPIIKFVDLIIMEAINKRASDIHIEHFENRVSLRYRIDGVLYEENSPDPRIYFAVISRVKILAKMDIAERRLPQDGGFSLSFSDRVIDIRVSSLPTIFGEKIVMRILDQTNLPLEFGFLGIDDHDLKVLTKAIYRPYGMIFISGPTGAGKSTTLYSVLNTIKGPNKNIVTVEDPVEYKLDGINQVQVKPLIGLNFASSLRSFLRQDPDVIMVGEVRDLETAQMCIRAALTGHLVLSTLHTNDAASTVTRIMDIGIEPFLLVSGLRLVVAQRLLRRLCEHCKERVDTKSDVRFKNIKITGDVYQSKGCEKCRFTGYKGRIGIFEFLSISEEIRTMIYYRKASDEIKNRARELGMRSLYEAGLARVNEGLTSLEEVLAVAIDE
ncbi:MAG: hypothetical protein DRP78_00570 [Candidatus Omnitrophota bacterium]|nr:MAG: hypothetical protein DRP78_00570 [Candidatus Omnitrophota bacterium]